jgi:hypothetical protein
VSPWLTLRPRGQLWGQVTTASERKRSHHGTLRRPFNCYCATKRTSFRLDVIEHQLAHAVRDPLGRAYNRTAHLAERRRMMTVWADYLDKLKADVEGDSVQAGGRGVMRWQRRIHASRPARARVDYAAAASSNR